MRVCVSNHYGKEQVLKRMYDLKLKNLLAD